MPGHATHIAGTLSPNPDPGLRTREVFTLGKCRRNPVLMGMGMGTGMILKNSTRMRYFESSLVSRQCTEDTESTERLWRKIEPLKTERGNCGFHWHLEARAIQRHARKHIWTQMRVRYTRKILPRSTLAMRRIRGHLARLDGMLYSCGDTRRASVQKEPVLPARLLLWQACQYSPKPPFTPIEDEGEVVVFGTGSGYIVDISTASAQQTPWYLG